MGEFGRSIAYLVLVQMVCNIVLLLMGVGLVESEVLAVLTVVGLSLITSYVLGTSSCLYSRGILWRAVAIISLYLGVIVVGWFIAIGDYGQLSALALLFVDPFTLGSGIFSSYIEADASFSVLFVPSAAIMIYYIKKQHRF